MAALPPALNVFVLARQYDTWVEQASGSVLLGTLVSVATLTTVMWLVQTGNVPLTAVLRLTHAAARRTPGARFHHAAAGAAGDADAGGGGRRGDQDRAAGRRGHAAASSRAGRARARRSRCSTAARQASCSISRAQADRERLMPLLERADVLVEQFRPGVMERLGLGYDAVRSDQSAPDLLLDHRLRPERPARRRGRPRPQLHRQHRAAGAAARAGGPPGGAAGADRRHRAAARFPAVINILLALRQRDQTGQGLPSRHRDDRRDVHLRLARAGARDMRPAAFPAPGELRLTGGSPRYQLYPTQGRQARRLRRAGAEVLGCVHARRSGLPPDSVDDSKNPRRRETRSRRSSRAQPPTSGGRCSPRPIAASPSSRRWRRRCAIRISSSAACSRIRCRAPSGATMPALPVPIAPRSAARQTDETGCRLNEN